MKTPGHASTDPASILRETLSTVRPLSTLSREGLILIALEHGHVEVLDYVPYAQAAASGLVEVREMNAGEAVAAVEAVTKSRPVVIFAGDTIVGGKQNRIVNVSIWLMPNTVTVIPVTCLEHGRWDSGRVFGSGRKADYALRAMVNRTVADAAYAPHHGTMPGLTGAAFRLAADQGAVWAEIGARESRIGRRSSSAALDDVYRGEADNVAEFTRALPRPPAATGVAVGVGGRIVALELFDSPERLGEQWERIVEGAASAHLDHQRAVAAHQVELPKHRFPDDGALDRLLGRARSSLGAGVATEAIGGGTDIRIRGPHVSGAALLHDGRAVHVELFRVEEPLPS